MKTLLFGTRGIECIGLYAVPVYNFIVFWEYFLPDLE